MCVAESLHCPPETLTTLLAIPQRKFKKIKSWPSNRKLLTQSVQRVTQEIEAQTQMTGTFGIIISQPQFSTWAAGKNQLIDDFLICYFLFFFLDKASI